MELPPFLVVMALSCAALSGTALCAAASRDPAPLSAAPPAAAEGSHPAKLPEGARFGHV